MVWFYVLLWKDCLLMMMFEVFFNVSGMLRFGYWNRLRYGVFCIVWFCFFLCYYWCSWRWFLIFCIRWLGLRVCCVCRLVCWEFLLGMRWRCIWLRCCVFVRIVVVLGFVMSINYLVLLILCFLLVRLVNGRLRVFMCWELLWRIKMGRGICLWLKMLRVGSWWLVCRGWRGECR